jgi:hypothetical protein
VYTHLASTTHWLLTSSHRNSGAKAALQREICTSFQQGSRRITCNHEASAKAIHIAIAAPANDEDEDTTFLLFDDLHSRTLLCHFSRFH